MSYIGRRVRKRKTTSKISVTNSTFYYLGSKAGAANEKGSQVIIRGDC